MNPFDIARKAGFDEKKIIDYLVSNFPGLEGKIKTALAGGYTAKQVIDFLKSNFKDTKDLHSYSKRQKAPSSGESLSRLGTQAERQIEAAGRQRSPFTEPAGLATVAGATALGGLSGGPAGLYGGFQGGRKLYEDIIGKQQREALGGPRMGLADFISSGLKGGVTGLGAYATAQSIPAILGSIFPGQETQLPQTPSVPQSPPPEPPLQESELGTLTPEIERDLRKAQRVLTENQQKKLELINRKLNALAGQGVEESDKRVQTLLRRKRQLETGNKEPVSPDTPRVEEAATEKPEELSTKRTLSIPEEETERFEKQYGRTSQGKSYSEVFEKRVSENAQRGSEIKKGQIKPFATALKSSAVSGATFDKDTNQLRIVFKSSPGKKGTVYEYENMDFDTFQKMSGGKAKPVTEGSSIFGVWYGTKDPSVGAAFSKFIRTNPDQFPYKKLDADAWTVEENALINADRSHIASEIFEPFKKVRLKGRQKTRVKGLKDIMDKVKHMDDDFLLEFVEYVEGNMKKLKKEPTVSQIQKEIEKRYF